MLDPRRIAIVLACGLWATQAYALERLVVVWDDGVGGAALQLRELAPPFASDGPARAVDPDGILRTAGGRIHHLSRATGRLSVLDAASGQTVASHLLDARDAPRDLAVIDADTVWLTRRNATHLLRLDLGTGATTEIVDLSPLADADGVPDMETLVLFEGRAYVQLRRESNTQPPFAPPAQLAVVDVATGTLVDADPVAPGVQGIALAGSSPRFKMQVVPATRELFVSATGFWMDQGGIERIDLDTLASLGLVVQEGVDDVGADLGAFVMTGATGGWLSFSTDIVLSSHLHAFSLGGGVDSTEVQFALFYFTPHLHHDPAGDRLYWPEPDGLRVFDATSGAAQSGLLPIPGTPTDLAQVTVPDPLPVRALPAGAVLGLLGGVRAAARLGAAHGNRSRASRLSGCPRCGRTLCRSRARDERCAPQGGPRPGTRAALPTRERRGSDAESLPSLSVGQTAFPSSRTAVRELPAPGRPFVLEMRRAAPWAQGTISV